jgi:hypothetical protein
MPVALPVVISGGIERPFGSLPTIGPGSAGTEMPGMVALLSAELAGLCAEAIKVDPKSDAASIERKSLDRMRKPPWPWALRVQLRSVVDVPTGAHDQAHQRMEDRTAPGCIRTTRDEGGAASSRWRIFQSDRSGGTSRIFSMARARSIASSAETIAVCLLCA